MFTSPACQKKHHSTFFTAHLGENYLSYSLYALQCNEWIHTCLIVRPWNNLLLTFSYKKLALFPFHGYFAPTVLSLREMGFTENSIQAGLRLQEIWEMFWGNTFGLQKLCLNLKIISSYDISHPWSHLNWLDLQEPYMAIVSTWNQDLEPYLYLDKSSNMLILHI